MIEIPLIVPDIRDSDISQCADVLKSGMLVYGAVGKELESTLTDHFGAPSLLMSNGTCTLHSALSALGIGPGDEVIVPAFSYVATANVVEQLGATSVFVDISLKSFNIDPDRIEEKITSNTKAIIPVHEFGHPADMSKVNELGRKYGLSIIEDAACAMGASYRGKLVGTLGDFGSFSFHPRKAMTSGEGGLLVVNDQTYLDKLIALRNHGWSNTGECIAPGFNYRLTDIQSSLLAGQFCRMPNDISRRRSIAKKYKTNIKGFNCALPDEPGESSHSWQSFHILMDDNLKRNTMIKQLSEYGIQTTYGAQCIPAMIYYKDKYGLDEINEFPNAWKAYQNGIVIPMYSGLTNEEVNFIISTFNSVSENL